MHTSCPSHPNASHLLVEVDKSMARPSFQVLVPDNERGVGGEKKKRKDWDFFAMRNLDQAKKDSSIQPFARFSFEF